MPDSYHITQLSSSSYCHFFWYLSSLQLLIPVLTAEIFYISVMLSHGFCMTSACVPLWGTLDIKVEWVFLNAPIFKSRCEACTTSHYFHGRNISCSLLLV
jgi:hypothetical protein